MDDSFKEQDSVEWNSPQGTIRGAVLKKVTEPTEIKGHTAIASPEQPHYLVQSYQTGELSIHKPEALRKL